MLYQGKYAFINGESFAVHGTDKTILRALADARQLEGVVLANASDDVVEALYTWQGNGWLALL
jgi:50S ribosomal protein L16 3-hydroxylase